jgi:tetratricopeptide (TPR) repeat protein
MRLQDNDKAVALLEVLVAVDAKDPQAHADLGALYFATGDQDGAELQFQDALRLKPNHAAALLGLGNLYLRKGEEDQAIPLLQKAAQFAAKAFEPRFLLGSAYNRLGRYQEAVIELESALRLGGNESEVYYHLARAYGGLDRQEDRRKALARFAELTRESKRDLEDRRKALRLMDQAKALVDSGDLLGTGS